MQRCSGAALLSVVGIDLDTTASLIGSQIFVGEAIKD